MKISHQWLSDFIELSESPEEIAALLTGSGLEVESIQQYETVKGGLRGVVIGTVRACEKHPNADKLHLTTVSVGSGEPLKIVCGAPNVSVGQRVAVALTGTTLYTFGGTVITLKSTKIRGEASEGMICAEDELGIGPSHDGIIVLNTELPDGTPASEYFLPYEDVVYEIGLTPNRADAASHLGVARDLKALLKRNVKIPAVSKQTVDNDQREFSVKIENSEGCIRYSGILLENIKVSESPDWLKNKLKAIGLHPINNVVDVTNYVCHGLGQPMHAFDAERIKGKKVVIKTLQEGTNFVTLDGKERKLKATDLMICDGEGGMCIAGIFGGASSGITASTTKVFLESACFAPSYIRKTSQHHQLTTDASFRFARGTDPNLTMMALEYAIGLLTEVAGAKVTSKAWDIYPQPIAHRTFKVSHSRINDLIGANLSTETTFPILNSLDIEVSNVSGDTYVVSVPPYRVDVMQEADVAEEVLRIYGFNAIPLQEHAGSNFIAEFPEKDLNKLKKSIGEMLSGKGYQEILTNSLSSEHFNSANGFSTDEGSQITILNKLSEDQGALRQTLLFTGLEVLAYNINRKEENLKLFEIGKVYWKNGRQEMKGQEAYGECEKIAIFITGLSSPESWQDQSRNSTFHDLVSAVKSLQAKTNCNGFKEEPSDHSCLQFGVRLIRGKKILGHMGSVKPAVLKNFGIKQAVWFAELDLALLMEGIKSSFTVREVPKFPKVRRDLSLVIDKQVNFKQIQDLIQESEKLLITQIGVFDVYEGKNLPEGKKAYALSFVLQDDEKTLTESQIDGVMEKLMHTFEQKLGAVIRK